MKSIHQAARLAVVLLVGAFMLLAGLPAAHANEVVSPAAEAGFAGISKCLQTHNDMAVLLAVDESASLQATDPDNKRAQLLATVVQSLGDQAGKRTATGTRKIELAVSTFSTDYQRLTPWTELTPSNTADIANQLEQDIPAKNQGNGTNHPAALRGARSEMSEVSASAAPNDQPCQVVVMFTDGVLDVSDSPAENDKAAAAMCRPKGPVDGLRRDGISLVTVMLFDQSGADASPKQYADGRALLKAAAEGTADGKTCGTVPIPATWASGAYLEGNVDGLASLFAGAFALSQGGTQIVGRGTPFNIQIDRGVQSFRAVAQAPNGVSLVKPSGDRVAIANGASGGGGVSARWDYNNVTVDVPVDDAAIGKWAVERPGQTDVFSVYLFTGLALKLDQKTVVAGQPTELRGQVVHPGSTTPVDLSVYREASMTASAIGGPGVPLQVNPGGTFTGTFTPGDSSTSQSFDISLNLKTSSGQLLEPIAGRFTVPVALPKEFPTVTPNELQLSPLEGKGSTAQGFFEFVGSSVGPTKVCADQATFVDIDDADAYSTQQSTGCFNLAAGERKKMDIAVTTSAPSDERVRGVIPLRLTSAGKNSREVATDLPVSFVSSRPVDEAVRGGLVAGLVAAGILIPLLGMYITNRLLARFAKNDGIRVGAFPVMITKTGVKAMPTERGDAVLGAFRLPADKLRFVPPVTKAQRQFNGPDGSLLRGRTPRLRNIFGAPRGEVTAPEGSRVFSNQSPFTAGSGRDAPISLGLGGSWYVTVPDAELTAADLDKGVRGTLSVFVPPRDGQAEPVAQTSEAIGRFAHSEAVLKLLIADVKKNQPKPASAGPKAPPSGPGGPPPGRQPRRPAGPAGPAGGPRRTASPPPGPTRGGSGGTPTPSAPQSGRAPAGPPPPSVYGAERPGAASPDVPRRPPSGPRRTGGTAPPPPDPKNP